MPVTINGTTGVSLVESGALPFLVGQVCFFAMDTAPEGFIKCNGAEISRSIYADLFAAIGTTFGAGDGSTTFELPDLRGEFLRGWDDGRGVDSGRGFGTSQNFALENITGNVVFRDQVGTLMGLVSNAGGPFGRQTETGYRPKGSTTSGSYGAEMTFDASNVASTANETRPVNTGLLACIKF